MPNFCFAVRKSYLTDLLASAAFIFYFSNFMSSCNVKFALAVSFYCVFTYGLVIALSLGENQTV